MLRRRIEAIGKYFWTKDRGVTPFVWGTDFNATIHESLIDKVDKLDALTEYEQQMAKADEKLKRSLFNVISSEIVQTFQSNLEKANWNRIKLPQYDRLI